MKHGSLFSGIGGFDLAAEWMGWENVFHCEWNDFGKRVLSYYWPYAISYNDITKTDFTIHRGGIDILTGGFPCQPYSAAGKRRGKDDERHLWPEMLRAIREIQPRWVVGENVFGIVNWNGGLVFDEVQADLEAEGYEVQAFVLPACAVNAPHRRDRVWFVAYAAGNGYDAESAAKNNTNGQNNKQSRTQWECAVKRPCNEQATTHADSNGHESWRLEQNRRTQGTSESGGQERERVWGYDWGIGQQGTTPNANFPRREERGEAGGRQNTAKDTTRVYSGVERPCDDGIAANTDSSERREGRLHETGSEKTERHFGTRDARSDGRPNWDNFPTQSPVRSRDDGVSTISYGETISKEHNMDRSLVIKGALDSGRLEVDFQTGKIYSKTIRGRKGEKVELLGADCNGYIVHNIYFDGVKKQCKAHQIVWIAANGLYDKNNLIIDHINRDRKDNRLDNLRLVTAKENRENSSQCNGKFTDEQKDLMFLLHTQGHMSFRELAEDFGCSKSRIHQIVAEHQFNKLDGITFSKWRNESIKAAGNAVVPQVVFEIFKAIEAYELKDKG